MNKKMIKTAWLLLVLCLLGLQSLESLMAKSLSRLSFENLCYESWILALSRWDGFDQGWNLVLFLAAARQLPWSLVTTWPKLARTSLQAASAETPMMEATSTTRVARPSEGHLAAQVTVKTEHRAFVSSPSCVFHLSLRLCFFPQAIHKWTIGKAWFPGSALLSGCYLFS